MTIDWQEQVQPGLALREIVQQATEALVQMDAERLEELARCCADLNRELQASESPAKVAADLDISAHEMKLLGRVLFETRANLTVFTRLQAMRLREAQAEAATGRAERSVTYGDN